LKGESGVLASSGCVQGHPSRFGVGEFQQTTVGKQVVNSFVVALATHRHNLREIGWLVKDRRFFFTQTIEELKKIK
jgi:hypothetical protein